MPVANRKSIRLFGSFVPADEPPPVFGKFVQPSPRGVVSSVSLLIDAAREVGKLDALAAELQKLADETDLHISVCHLPPGTSKWNKIEHRLFSFISQNWRGKPLVSHEVIVNLISATTTETGLKVQAELDTNSYPPGAKVSKKQIEEMNIRPDSFHGEGNYTIRPNR